VQALIKTLFPCYAPGDRETARAIAEFLERGADVRVFLEDGEIREGEDILSKARDARTADLALVLFSRESMPGRWRREQWQPALVDEPAEEKVPIAFLRCDDCIPPKVLTPMFGPRQLRELKRWVRGHIPESSRSDGELDLLAIAVADRPGTEVASSADVAAEFAREFHQDFDAVLTLQCGRRSIAALAGDLAAQLGLRLEGPLPENLERLTEFCSMRRFLIVLEEVPDLVPHELVFGGRCSTLAAPDGRTPEADPIREVQRIVAGVDSRWPDVSAAARLGRRLLRDAGRMAELHELMVQWHSAAEDEDDRLALDESAREIVWILEAWGRPEEAHELEFDRACRFDDQMMLPFS
jgi:hypothetical protein